MPNWCMNYLTLSGPEDVIKEIADSGLSLQKLFPCPQELLDTTAPASSNDKEKAEKNLEKYGHADWYSWQVSNWGTKWDIGPIELEVEGSGKNCNIFCSFDSAWSPPTEAMEKLFDKYKNRGLSLRMEYIESGCGFLGVCSGKNKDFWDDYYEYNGADELLKFATRLDHSEGLYEAEYLREHEAEEAAADEQPVEVKSTKPKKAAKPAKKAASKKAAPKKPAKKPSKKTSKK